MIFVQVRQTFPLKIKDIELSFLRHGGTTRVMLIRRASVTTIVLMTLMGSTNDCGNPPQCVVKGTVKLQAGECRSLSAQASCVSEMVFETLPYFDPSGIASLRVAEVAKTLEVCGVTGASVGNVAKIATNVPEKNLQIDLDVEIVDQPALLVDVQVPAAMNPGSVLVDSGRTIVAMNTPIIFQGVPKGSTVLKPDASVMWQSAIAGQVMASPMGNVAVGTLHFNSPGEATATVNIKQDGVDSSFETKVFVKAPSEPLASATIRRVRNETGADPCTDDTIRENAEMTTCSWKLCVDASASRAKWGQPAPRPNGFSFEAHRGAEVATVPKFVDVGRPDRAAICGDDETLSVRVVVTEGGTTDMLELGF